jgi:D-psicose/D-tagatose/L-ribulose 3-epimerase
MTRFPISAMLTSLPLDFEPAVRQAVGLGFRFVDVVAMIDRPRSHVEALAEADATVACCPIGRDLPEAQTLDADAVVDRRAAVDAMKRQLADAALLGATQGYVIPGKSEGPEALARFTEACDLLATFAAQRMIKLCVEHVPGRALPTAAGTLQWLEEVDHPNLFLLLDVGHCTMSGEDAPAIVARAGARLGYVHFDDNDGVGDLHWPLLTGKLTEERLRAVLDALPAAGYRGPLALELNPRNADPAAGLRDGKAHLERLLREM